MNCTDGSLMFGRVSLGWNFHRSRTIKTFVVGLALSFCKDRFLLTVGPVTFVYLKGKQRTPEPTP